MTQGFCECYSHSVVGLEELMGKMLSKEGEHKIGSLRVRIKRLATQKLLHKHLWIGKSCLAYREERKSA